MVPHRSTAQTPSSKLKLAEQPMAVPFQDVAATKLNARVVEFIAKPRRTEKLRSLLCQAVTSLLRDHTGFIRTVILTKHEEPRRVVVITFWNTREQAMNNTWEEIPQVQGLLSPLVDTWSSARTYEADLEEATDSHSQSISLPVC